MKKELWAFNATQESVYVCRGDHVADEDCRSVKMSPKEIVEYIHDLKQQIQKMKMEIESLQESCQKQARLLRELREK